jgi:hypothetical protein
MYISCKPGNFHMKFPYIPSGISDTYSNTLLWSKLSKFPAKSLTHAELADTPHYYPGSRVPCIGVDFPIIKSLFLANAAPCSGFVQKSAIISSVGHQSMETLSFLTISVTKKYRTLMCFVLLLLEAFPFFSRSMALLLSCKITFPLPRTLALLGNASSIGWRA